MYRKFLTIIMALMVVFSLAVPAFASTELETTSQAMLPSSGQVELSSNASSKLSNEAEMTTVVNGNQFDSDSRAQDIQPSEPMQIITETYVDEIDEIDENSKDVYDDDIGHSEGEYVEPYKKKKSFALSIIDRLLNFLDTISIAKVLFFLALFTLIPPFSFILIAYCLIRIRSLKKQLKKNQSIIDEIQKNKAEIAQTNAEIRGNEVKSISEGDSE